MYITEIDAYDMFTVYGQRRLADEGYVASTD